MDTSPSRLPITVMPTYRRGLMQGDYNLWRPAFLLGLVGLGPVLSGLMPNAFEIMPETFTVSGTALLCFEMHQ